MAGGAEIKDSNEMSSRHSVDTGYERFTILRTRMRPATKPIGPLPLRLFFRRPLPLESETCWFLLLGVLDLVLTTMLLAPAEVRESNPVARFCLHAGGLRGLIIFKFGMLAGVTVIAQIIALRRVQAARIVLLLGIVISFLVATYSVVLLLRKAHLIIS